MKGTCFQKPLEFNLSVEGESWNQGAQIVGTLTVKIHGNLTTTPTEVVVHLGQGVLKKVRQKSADAFSILASFKTALQTETALPWKFQLDSNCAITDGSTSLFLLYGSGDAPEQLGHLQLTIVPNEMILEFLKTLTTQFRFIMKSLKAGKGHVEAKLVPPASQLFATLDHVMLHFRFEGETLEVQYVFVVKKIEATAAAFEVTKQKRELTQALPKRSNPEHLETLIKEALKLVEAKILF